MNGQTTNPTRNILVLVAAKLIDKVLQESKPEEAGAIFYMLLAESAGELPEEFWTQVMKLRAAPCEIPGCDCEMLRGSLLQVLDKLRNNYQSSKSAAAGEKELSA